MSSCIFANPDAINIFNNSNQREQIRIGGNGPIYVKAGLSKLEELYILPEKPINPIELRKGAVDRFKLAADGGYPLAMFLYGVALQVGFGCKRDPIAGMALIKVAGLVRQSPDALNYLGLCYVSVNKISDALKFFILADNLGYASAKENIDKVKLHYSCNKTMLLSNALQKMSSVLPMKPSANAVTLLQHPTNRMRNKS